MIISYEKGLAGEKLAERYLMRAGFVILARRYRVPGGEIDLIAREGDTVCFVEVKYRPDARLSEALDAMTPEKAQRLRVAQRVWLREHPARRTRLDLIEITRAGIRLLRGQP